MSLRKNFTPIVYGILVLLAGAGVIGIWFRFSQGLKATALTSYVPWGIWVSAYTFLIGLAGGCVFLVSPYVLWGRREFLSLVGPAFLAAWVSLAGGMVFIWLDLGNPWRFLNLYLHPNWDSSMVWEAWGYPVFFLVIACELYLWHLPSLRHRMKPLKYLEGLSCLLAFFVIWDSGSAFAQNYSRPLWHGGWEKPLTFILLALVSGAAFLLLVHGGFDSPSKNLKKVDRELAWVLLFGVIFFAGIEGFRLWEAWSSSWSTDSGQTWKTIVTGPYSYVFWIGQLGLLLVVPALSTFLGLRRSDSRWLSLCGLSVLVGVFASRLNFIIPGLTEPAFAELDQTYQHPRLSVQYFPTLTEWIITIGLGAIIILAYLVTRRMLNHGNWMHVNGKKA